MISPRLVLLDFDGVIADTANVHIAAWERTFSAMGWEVAHEVCSRAAEEDDRAFLTNLFKEKGVRRGDVEGWVRRKQRLTLSMLHDAPRIYPGVAELIRRLEDRCELAVVTDTWRENVETVLRSAGLEKAFKIVVGKEDVKRPKPAPDGYLLALERLATPPEMAVTIEDSPTGLLAARNAGIRGLAVGHRRKEGEWTGESAYVSDLKDLAAVLGRLGINK